MGIYSKNLDFFKRKAPDFFDKLITDEFRHPQLQVLDELQGSIKLQLGDRCCFLHSVYDKEREMQNLFGQANDDEQTLIIFGLGMGYCVDYLVEHHVKYREVHIIEPFDNVFKVMLAQRDLSALLSLDHLSLHLIREPQEMYGLIWNQLQLNTTIKLLYHLSYRSIFTEFYDEVERLFANRTNIIMSTIATTDQSLYIWTSHQLKSVKEHGPQADILYNKYHEIPAIIVSAGPSLERHLDLLKEIGDRALIVAPGTGARILDQRGIKAHLAMAMDAWEPEADIFEGYQGTCPLVGSFRLHPRISQEFPNRILWFATSNDRLAQYYYHRFQNKSMAVIDDNPSVSICAIDYAFKLGCNPIILIGQDLCYYDHKVHAGEEAGSLASYNGAPHHMLDINGLPVITDNAFLSMRHSLELQNQKYGGRVQIINATEAGLGIPGIENLSFREAIARYINPQGCDVAKIIEEAQDVTTHDNAGEHDFVGFYDHLLDQIDFIERKNRDKWALLRKLDKLQKRQLKISRLNEQMIPINDINTELECNNFYKEVIMSGLSSIVQHRLVAVQCKFGPKEKSPEAFKIFETFLLDVTARYLTFIKNMVNEEIGVTTNPN
ncbi:MAG: 6-hydroxymethylpterin diphosphokinase MptE-like protein [Thermacetogeniaceae bacterium]|jgi:hypothetical protein